MFEITIGTSMASQAAAPLIARVSMCSAIIAWSGLSVHAQVAAVIQPSGLSVWPYAASRFLQSIVAAAMTAAFMKAGASRWSLPTFEPYVITGSLQWFRDLGAAAKLCLACMGAFAAASVVLIAWDVIRRRSDRI